MNCCVAENRKNSNVEKAKKRREEYFDKNIIKSNNNMTTQHTLKSISLIPINNETSDKILVMIFWTNN